jgi:hypothetical protein
MMVKNVLSKPLAFVLMDIPATSVNKIPATRILVALHRTGVGTGVNASTTPRVLLMWMEASAFANAWLDGVVILASAMLAMEFRAVDEGLARPLAAVGIDALVMQLIMALTVTSIVTLRMVRGYNVIMESAKTTQPVCVCARLTFMELLVPHIATASRRVMATVYAAKLASVFAMPLRVPLSQAHHGIYTTILTGAYALRGRRLNLHPFARNPHGGGGMMLVASTDISGCFKAASRSAHHTREIIVKRKMQRRAKFIM